MMVALARTPTDLDLLLNEGVAHTIRMFLSAETSQLPVGMHPVMIGRRARWYNTVKKVLDRLNRVYDILFYMQRLDVMVINVE